MLPEGEQVMVRVQQGKLFLPPGFHLQGAGRVYGYPVVHDFQVQFINGIGADIHLSVVVGGVQFRKGKEMKLDAVFLHHQVIGKVTACLVKTRLPGIIGQRARFDLTSG